MRTQFTQFYNACDVECSCKASTLPHHHHTHTALIVSQAITTIKASVQRRAITRTHIHILPTKYIYRRERKKNMPHSNLTQSSTKRFQGKAKFVHTCVTHKPYNPIQYFQVTSTFTTRQVFGKWSNFSERKKKKIKKKKRSLYCVCNLQKIWLQSVCSVRLPKNSAKNKFLIVVLYPREDLHGYTLYG